jgi:hypothetical protein
MDDDVVSSSHAHHDAAASAAAADIDLYALSDAQLEEICTVRGFELVHDDDDETFTHDDYVEAARQCLAIEEDMHDILQEHPEILEELEQEREYMMHEKERLERELLKEAEKRADGRQHYPNETEQEEEEEEAHEVVDLDEEPDFDVVGHQEPLSDSRVHQETTTTTSSVQETDSSNENSLSFRETVREFQERIQRDFNAVADIVFPKAMRGPTREALRKAGLFIKKEAINVYRFVVRYIKAFIEKRKHQTNDENEIQGDAIHQSEDATVVQ